MGFAPGARAALLALGLTACSAEPGVAPTADAQPSDARPSDARPSDARPSDAAAPDQTTDAAGADLGAPDLGPPDAGPDLGPLDAGPDLAPPDAEPDLAPPDAGLADARPPPVEVCDNGRDDDANDRADCDDAACAAHPACLLAAPEADCADDADDDADGLADCDDPGCAREPVCAPPPAFTEASLRARFELDCNRCHPFLIDEFLGLTANRTTAGLNTVEPGRHRASYLWHKLNGSHLSIGGRGDPMPIGRPRWSPADVARFGAWINAQPPRP